MMRLLLHVLCLLSLVAVILASTEAVAAEGDVARPPDRILLSANGSRLAETEEGGGGSLSLLHYFSTDAVVGLGAERQVIADSRWTFGSLRGSLSRGEPDSRFNISAEVHRGNGDDNGREFDYSVLVLGLSQSFTSKFSIQLEGREIDIDTSRGNLPKLGLTYLLTPRLLSNVSYAYSVGGNLGTELASARLDYYGRHFSFMIGGAAGSADPAVLNLQPGLTLPANDLRQGFIGLGRTFTRGEIHLLGDYLVLDENEKITVTLTFVGYLRGSGGAR